MIHQTDLSQFSCAHLRGVGKAILEKLNRMGVFTLQDLLFHLPFRYEDKTKIFPIAKVPEGQKALVMGVVQSVAYPQHGKTKLLCELRDSSRRLGLRFFHVYSSHKKMIEVGARLLCYGEIRFGPTGLEMTHPEWQVVEGDEPILDQYLTPVYPTTEGLSQNMWRKLMQQALTLATNESFLQEHIPANLLASSYSFSLREALLYVHRPPKDANLELLEQRIHPAQRRLVFEELLAHRLGLLKFKKTLQHFKAVELLPKSDIKTEFLKTLSFELTTAQKRVVDEIASDMACPYPMLRLVQGDVGSGKTVVAALAVLRAIENDCQAAVMAPTELLAEQHYRVFKQWLEPLNIPVAFLSGQMKAKERRDTLNALVKNQVQVIVGTHALFQKDVVFAKLALIVVDEQHRFGVHQRALLREKGLSESYVPHQLIMTATPIPRTLAMSMYADLDCSVIDELPRGRIPIQTRVISSQRRDEVVVHVRQACKSGRQAYWVCPLIDESDVLECQAAEQTAQQFRLTLPDLRIGLLHGRMNAAEKEQTMQAFKSQQLDLLVATTVIEVGVDVPNASLMIIENAERLGLSQLHQLRGRVGRGAIESHCVLLYQPPASEFATKRLAAIRNNHDGFKIAEQDLELRGPGDVLGLRQTGDIAFKMAELMRDSVLLPAVSQAAAEMVASHTDVVELLLKRWLPNEYRYTHV
jgi:ATP-dependent DNA helicase RecG